MREFKCALYGRVSTDRQAGIKDGGLDTQFSVMEKRLEYENSKEADNWLLVDHYREEGWSGKTIERPEFKRLMTDIESGRINTVIVHKIDRLTRSLLDFARILQVFERHDIAFVSVTQQFDTSSSTGRLMVNILLSFAQFEREMASERTSATMQHRAQQGLKNGGRSFGYDTVAGEGKKGLLVENPELAQIVREEIFGKFLDLGSARAVTRHLQEIGVRMPAYESRRGKKRGGGIFSKDRVLSILTNPVYVGKVRYKEEIYEGQHEGIVDPDVFEQAQKLLATNRKTRKNGKTKHLHTYLLQGMLRCGSCDSMMTPTASGGKSVYHYYQCVKTTKSCGKQCGAKYLPAKAVEEFVLGEIEKVALDQTVIDKAIARANELAANSIDPLKRQLNSAGKRLKQINKQISPIIRALETGEPFESIKARLAELEAEKQSIQAKLTELQLEHDNLESQQLSAEMMAHNYRTLPQILAAAKEVGAWQEIKELLRCYVQQIEWHPDPGDKKRGRVDIMLYEQPARCDLRAEWRGWLPEQDSNL